MSSHHKSDFVGEEGLSERNDMVASLSRRNIFGFAAKLRRQNSNSFQKRFSDWQKGSEQEDEQLVDELAYEEDEENAYQHDEDEGVDNSVSNQQVLAEKHARSIGKFKWALYVLLLICAIVGAVLVYLRVSNDQESSLKNDFNVRVGEVAKFFRQTRDVKNDWAETLAMDIVTHIKHTGRQFPYAFVPGFEAMAKEALQVTDSELIMFVPFVPTVNQTQYEEFVQEHASQWLGNVSVPMKIHDLLEYQSDSGGHEGHSGHGSGGHEGTGNDMPHGDMGNMSHGDMGDMPHGGMDNMTGGDMGDMTGGGMDGMTGGGGMDGGMLRRLNAMDMGGHHGGMNGNTGDMGDMGGGHMGPGGTGYEQGDEELPFVIEENGIEFTNVIAPLWQTYPSPTNASVINADLLLDSLFSDLSHLVYGEKRTDISPMRGWMELFQHFYMDQQTDQTHAHTTYVDDGPRSLVLSPLYWKPSEKKGLVGLVSIVYKWSAFMESLVSSGTNGLDVVINDSCGSLYTYGLTKDGVVFKGEGELHESTEFDSYMKTISLNRGTSANHDHQVCIYSLDIYVSEELRREHITYTPLFFAVTVAGIFGFLFVVFYVYDWTVLTRQTRVLLKAQKAQAIVSSAFPKNVQSRLLDQEADADNSKRLNGDFGGLAKYSKPIADLFPDATVLFADLAGFTAWSSTREPTQVFELLETLYGSFDKIAKRQGIFKVETVGDCYVAVAGLPQPRQDHAVAMVRFAAACLQQFSKDTKQLVRDLGPDTEDLGLRIGIHTGPVTAGVLRGEKARFQLFGDTVNVAARIESTGIRNRIHVSEETAAALRSFDKSIWLNSRSEKVVAKGKGELLTFFVTPDQYTKDIGAFELEDDFSGKGTEMIVAPKKSIVDKYSRLVGWNTDVLVKILKQMIARRESLQTLPENNSLSEIRKLEKKLNVQKNILDEVQEVVALPQFTEVHHAVDANAIELADQVEIQLKEYIQLLAGMYQDNPFHNFEHASHVAMSVTKLLSRIVAPDKSVILESDEALHDHTYGITSDPMTQFAVVFSALIHDADHPGVPNTRLIQENAELAAVFDLKSVAEQNSVCLAWDLLMQDRFEDLRNVIYVTKAEFLRFRQLVVNIVLATDIMDKDLAALRKERWQKAFSEESVGTDGSMHDSTYLHTDTRKEDVDRKATIVMEHLIQASDVSHTMQHWHIFQKWNKRLFMEMYDAYLQGRAEKDPSVNWFEGEQGFFDFYIIPLAKKLKDCGVFGVSSDEYLQYAIQNRREWERKGQEIVAAMVEEYQEVRALQEEAN